MYCTRLLVLVAVLSFSSGLLAHPHPQQQGWEDYIYHKRQLLARQQQQPLSNITRPNTSAQPPITPAPRPSISVSGTLTTIGSLSSAPATSTVSNGEVIVAIIGATYVASVGGAVLMVGGIPHTLAAGTIVTITGGGPNGDIPEVETISNPNRSQSPQTSDPASKPTSTPITPTSTSSASPTSSAPSSSTAAPTSHIVLFAQKATAEEIEAVKRKLNNDAAPNSLSEVASDRTGLVVFFKAGLSPTQADAIGQEPGVSGVFVDETLEEEQPPSTSTPPLSTSRHPTATGPPGSPKSSVPNPANIKLQSDAADELKVISQPPGSALADLTGYGYANEGGKGVTIYVIDTGANAQNSEWSGMPGTKSFFYAPGAIKEETDFLNHGSCVASKADGPVYGTAKDADMIAVKLPRDLSLSAIFEVLIDISNDVFQKKLEGKAVVNMSLGSRIPDKVFTVDAYKLLLVALMAEDIVIVTASGNDAQYGIDNVTEYPALFGPTTDIIVVGAVENEGYRAFFSQGTGDQLTVSAPGFVDCANGRSTGSQELYGTSFATPAVAGVIAVWLSQEEYKARLQVPGQVAANVKKLIKELAYSRVEGEPAVIWNGIDSRGLACSANTNGKRQASPPNGSGSCQASSAAPSNIVTSAPPASTASAAFDPVRSLPTSPSSTSQPSPPPKPKWSADPSGFVKAFEQDGVASAYYDSSSDSASEGVMDNIEQWCLAKCTGSCASVFLYRVLQFNAGRYNIFYICNQYNKHWSTDFVQIGIESADSGVAFK